MRPAAPSEAPLVWAAAISEPGPPPRESPKPTQQPPNEVVTAIATELQELASRAQSLLAKLADSGLVTADEVIEQKRRFLG